MTMAALEKEKVRGSRLDGLFGKVALVTICFFCLNFLFNYSSLGGPAREKGTWLAAWIGDSSPLTSLQQLLEGPEMDLIPGVERDRYPEGEAVDTRLELYNVADIFNSGQVLARFRNVCYNGSHILTLGEKLVCENAHHEAPAGRWGPLIPQRCSNEGPWNRHLAGVMREYGMPFAARDRDWFESRSRSGSLAWEPATSSFIFLDRTTANVAHFLGKMNMLLLFNGASIPVPALRDMLVEKFLFTVHPNREEQWANTSRNQQGFLATYMAGTLNRVLAPLQTPELRGPDLVAGDGHRIVAAQGRVTFSGIPFMDASEDRPLCFQQVFLPGILKFTHYVGLGGEVADIVRQHFRDWLHLEADAQQPGAGPAVLLYIRREGSRRIFFPESERRLAPVLEGVEGFTVRNISYSKMSFRDQLKQTQEADVVISLHGANLMNPSMLARRNSILIELGPYRVLHRMYETQAIHSGIIYMAHQLDQGTPQEADDGRFKGLAYISCMNVPACKDNFVHRRNVELLEEDMRQIQALLAVARRIHFELTRKGITVHDRATTGKFRSALLHILKEETGVDVSCGPYRSTKNDQCRSTWLAFVDVGGAPTLCYIAIRCSS